MMLSWGSEGNGRGGSGVGEGYLRGVRFSRRLAL